MSPDEIPDLVEALWSRRLLFEPGTRRVFVFRCPARENHPHRLELAISGFESCGSDGGGSV
jgi:hypothetical protein